MPARSQLLDDKTERSDDVVPPEKVMAQALSAFKAQEYSQARDLYRVAVFSAEIALAAAVTAKPEPEGCGTACLGVLLGSEAVGELASSEQQASDAVEELDDSQFDGDAVGVMDDQADRLDDARKALESQLYGQLKALGRALLSLEVFVGFSQLLQLINAIDVPSISISSSLLAHQH